eukprot:5052621-Pyramimonas_sp.AAC.1
MHLLKHACCYRAVMAAKLAEEKAALAMKMQEGLQAAEEEKAAMATKHKEEKANLAADFAEEKGRAATQLRRFNVWWYTVTQTALANKMHAGLTAADKEKAALANKLGEEKAALSARWQQQ